MFLRVDGSSGSSVIINLSKIISVMEDGSITFEGAFSMGVTKESAGKIISLLLEEETPPSAKVKDDGILSELNVLVGGNKTVKETGDRKARLKARLKDFSAEELKTAAKNLGQDEYMQGANDSGKRWGTLDYLLRTSANVNKWLEHEAPKKKRNLF